MTKERTALWGQQLQLIQLRVHTLFLPLNTPSYLRFAGRVTTAAGGGTIVGCTIVGCTRLTGHRIGATWCWHWLPPGFVNVCGKRRRRRCGSCSCSASKSVCLGQRVAAAAAVVGRCCCRCCCCCCWRRIGQRVVLVGLLHSVDIAHRTLEIGCKQRQRQRH